MRRSRAPCGWGAPSSNLKKKRGGMGRERYMRFVFSGFYSSLLSSNKRHHELMCCTALTCSFPWTCQNFQLFAVILRRVWKIWKKSLWVFKQARNQTKGTREGEQTGPQKRAARRAPWTINAPLLRASYSTTESSPLNIYTTSRSRWMQTEQSLVSPPYSPISFFSDSLLLQLLPLLKPLIFSPFS
jgi:hypothetical protein